MNRKLDDIRYFHKWIGNIESDIFFPKLKKHASYPDYQAVKDRVLSALESGDYDYVEIHKDVSYMETFTNPYYAS